MSSAKLGLAIVVIGGLAIVAADVLGFADVEDGRAAQLIALLAVGIWVSAGVIGNYRGQLGQALPHIAIWIAIITAIALVYAWSEPIKAFLGLPPGDPAYDGGAPAGEPEPRRFSI